MLTPSELHRYSRQILLSDFGLAGQEKLKNASVLVIGAGGLGSPALLYLAAAGVGRLGIIDFDVVDVSNLQRQVLFNTADVGKPKAQMAAERVRAINPTVSTDVYIEQISSANALDILSKYDLILDGSDNLPTRYLVNDACVLLNKPLIYGAVFQFEGQVSVFNQLMADGTRGPNYRDLFAEPPPPEFVPSCSEGGVLGVLPGMIGTMQANEAIKILTSIGTSLGGRLLLLDALDFTTRIVNIRKNPSASAITGLIDYVAFCNPASKTFHAISEISVQELKTLIDSKTPFQLIDVREPSEVSIVSIHGENIPLKNIEQQSTKIRKDIPIIVHCKSGGRSATAVRKLQTLGFTNTKNLTGGILKWIETIDPSLPRY
jgi:molybdopterin/thiamine biosynthesis adenylyltransferase/rhodanese-related sulfurtransferase